MAGSAVASTLSWDPDGNPSDGADGGPGSWDLVNPYWYNGSTDVIWPNFTTSSDTAVFGGTGGTVTLGAPVFANGLQFNVDGYTIDNGGVPANTLTLSGAAQTISVTNAGTTATISAVLSSTGGITKTGNGALTLSGSNTFGGNIQLNAGTLNINNANALGNAAGTFTINGGTIDNTTGGLITVAANNVQNWFGNFAFGGTQALNLGTGAVQLSGSRQIAVNGSTLTVGGVITGAGYSITKTGAGTLNLTGANAFSGGLNINQGVVSTNVGGGLGAGVVTFNGGTLLLNQTAQITLSAAQVLNIGAAGGTIDNAVAFKLLLSTAGGLTGSGTLTRAASANNTLANIWQISVANVGFTGAVNLTGGVTEINSNGLGTGLAAGNTITLNTGAELSVNNGTILNALIVNGGVFAGDQATSTYAGTVTVNGAGSVRLGDFFQNTNRNLNITGAITGAGSLTTINNGNTLTNATGQILTLNPTNGNNAGFTGALTIGSGNNVVFTTTNALTGGTVTANTTATQMGGVGYGYDFGATVPTFVNNRTGATTGGVFGINTGLSPSTSLDMSTLGGGGMFLGSQTTGAYTSTTLGTDGGVYRLGGGTGTLVLPNATLTDAASSLVVGDSRANGNGTVVLSGANTFTGGVTVAGGTLAANSINSVSGGSAASALGAPTNIANGTLNLGSTTSAGALRYTGAGETTDRVVNLAGTTGGATLDNSGSGLLKFTSDLTATGAGTKTLTLTGAMGANGEFAGKIANATLTIAKSSPNTWTLSGAGNSVQQLTLSGGTIDIGANDLTLANLGGNVIQASIGTTTINGTGTLKLSSNGAADGGNIGAATGATIVINAPITTTTAGGAVELFSAAGSTGTVVLNGTNTYTGNTFINSGALQVSSIANALGSGTTLNVGNGTGAFSTFRYTGAGETTTKVINLNNSTGAATLEQSGTGLLKFTSNFTATNASVKTLTLQGSTAGTGEIAGIIPNNSGTNTTSILKAGTGLWTLSGANSYTGSTTVTGGTLLLNGETGSIINTTALTVNGSGTFGYLGKSTGSSQTFASLSAGVGQSNISTTYGGGGTTSLIFGTYARSAGGTAFFNPAGGTNGTNNFITINGQSTTGFINGGTYFGTSDFAYYNGTGATGYVRGPQYGTDANFVISTGGATIGQTTHVRLDAAVTAQTTTSVDSLKIAGAFGVTNSAGATLTINSGGIIAAGGAATIGPAGTTLTSGAAEMVINTPTAGDSLNITSVLAGAGLTKTGGGTLTLTNTANTFTGNIFVNGGNLAFAGSGTADQGALGAAGARNVTLSNGAILTPLSTANPAQNTKAFVIGTGGGTFNVGSGVTLQLDDGGQFSGTGDLTVTGAGTGVVILSNQAFTFSGNVFVNSGTLRVSGNTGILGANAGRTVTVGSGGVLDTQVATLPLGLVLNGTGISNGGALINSAAITVTGGYSGPVTINAGASIGGTGALVLSGPVTGAGLTKVGTGLLTLSGANSYGTTTISGGTVLFSSLGAIGAGGASISVANGAAVGVGIPLDQDFLSRITTPANSFTVALGADSANALNFSTAGFTTASLGAANGTFNYSGTLTPNGTTYRLGGGGGTLLMSKVNAVTGGNDLVVGGNTTLAGDNNYSGTTTVNAGTLAFGGTIGTSAITVAAGATLQIGTGGTTGSIGTATIATGSNTSVISYNHSDNITTNVFTGAGGLMQAGLNRLTVNSATTTISRLFFSAPGTVDIGSTPRTIGTDGGNGIQVTAIGTSTIDGTAPITIGGNGMDVGGTVAASTLVINPVIQGTNNLDFFGSGTGTVVLNGANTYSGVTSLQNSVVVASSLNSVATNAGLGTVHSASSSLGAPTTVANGTIAIGNNAASTLRYVGTGEITDRVINLAGTTFGATLDQSGTGLLKFTSNFTATGGGIKTLTLQGSTAGAGEIGGAIVDNSGTNKTNLAKSGTDTWTLSGTSTYTGTTTVNGGTLNLTGTLGSTAITVSTLGTFNESSTGVIGGTATLTVNGSTTLSGNNTFTGAVSVKDGPLTITNSSALGTGTKTITIIPTTNPSSQPSLRLDGSGGNITLPSSFSFSTSYDALTSTLPIPGSAAVINVAGDNTIQGNFSIPTGGGGTSYLVNAGTLTLSGTITSAATGRSVSLRGNGNGFITGNMTTGSGAWFVSKDAGSGTWTLSGTNTYNGTTSVSAGTLQFAKRASLYNSTTASWTATNIFVNNGGTLAFNVGGANEFTTSDIDTLKALGSATGGFLNGSSLGLDTTNASGGTFSYATPITNTNSNTNAVGLTKLGLNTLSLSGANTYTGPTNVNAGILAITATGAISGTTLVKIANGATLDVSAFNGLGNFAVGGAQTVNDNGTVSGNLNVSGTLSGSGSVTGTVTALTGSIIAPGNSPGTLTISSDFALQSGSHLAFELGTTSPGGSDQLAIASGNVTLGGSLDLSLLGSYVANPSDVFTLILDGGASPVAGTFSNVTPIDATTGTITLGGGQQFLINYAANLDGGGVANDVTAMLVPEPGTCAVLLAGASLLMARRRRRS